VTRRVPALDLLPFAEKFGIALYDWQRDAFGAACERVDGRFTHRLCGISVPRGNGKSWAGSVVGLWRLLCGPRGHEIASVALDYEGAKVVLAHAKALVRQHPVLSREVEVTANGLSVPSRHSRWSIFSSEHGSSRGRHPDVVLYDECAWSRDDELFSSLLAGQASVDDPLMLVISTVGRRQSGPLWTVKMLAEGGDASVFWWHSGENLSPKVTADFLARQRRILVPSQYAREHGNVWVDAADSFVTPAMVDAAMSGGWLEQQGQPQNIECHAFVDVGVVHDPSVIAVGHRDADGMIYLDALLTFQGSRAEPVRIETLEAALLDLSRRFNLTKIRIESWQGIATVQRLERLGLPVETFSPTPKSNAEEWPQLAQRLANGTLVMFPHARLREELLNLTVEVTATGAKIIDRGRVHQDHATSLRGVVASLGQATDAYIMGTGLSRRPTYTALTTDAPAPTRPEDDPSAWDYSVEHPARARWSDIF